MDEQINDVLKYLSEQEGFLPYACIWHDLKDNYANFHIEEVLLEIDRLGIVAVRTDNTGHKEYMVTYPAKKAIAGNSSANLYEYFQEHRHSSKYPIEAEMQSEAHMDKGVAIDIIIKYLGTPEHRNDEYSYDELTASLGIPKEAARYALQTLTTSRGWLKCPPTLPSGNPKVKITDKGIKHFEELDKKHFELTEESLMNKPTPALPLDETCEVLFQMHKNGKDYSVPWYVRDVYHGKPENLKVAREKLLKKEIIYYKDDPRKITLLNPELFDVDSYNEAIEILKPKPQAPTTSIIMRDGIATIGQVRDSDLSVTITPPTNPQTAAPINDKTTLLGRLGKIISKNITQLIFAIIGGLIVGYLLFYLNWA